MNTDEHRWKKGPGGLRWLREKRTPISVFICVLLWTFLLLSCGSKPIDPQTAVPADALVYLETKDLGGVLKAITDNEAFRNAAKSVPDFSVLNGMKLSVAVTGFQTSEEALSEENAVLNFKPRFVAVVETNAWNYQALSFTENKLGEFINEIYDGEIELVTSDKHGGKYFIWTANDGRKAYALVRGSLILIGNDESAVDTCVNVMNGGADSIAKNAKVSAFALEALASGYISKDGVAQIANIAGVSLAVGTGEETEVKSFIARVLPEILRNSVTEATWTARRLADGRIEDSYAISLPGDTARVFSETIKPGDDDSASEISQFIPKEYVSTTRYNFKDPQIVWRSILLTTRTKTDQVAGQLLTTFSSSLLEPYGIDDPERFLGNVSGAMQTVKFDAEGDEVVLIVGTKDIEAARPEGIAKELNAGGGRLSDSSNSLRMFGSLWSSEDGELLAGRRGNVFIIGDAESVSKCITAYFDAEKRDPAPLGSNAVVATTGNESDPRARLVTVLSDRKDEAPLNLNYFTETRFNQNGIERRTVSDFSLIGMIIARLDSDN